MMGAEHYGQISGHKSDELKTFIRTADVSWLNNNGKIVLGELTNGALLYLDGKMEEQFIYNLLEYALLRERFKREK